MPEQKIKPIQFTLSNYFKMNELLEKKLGSSSTYKALVHTDEEIVTAANKVEEFIESFTWETKNTDLIRIAFIEIAKDIQKQLDHIKVKGMYPDIHNAEQTYKQQLLSDIAKAFKKALHTQGHYYPTIVIQSTTKPWDHSKINDYINNTIRHLSSATFDNLLEAVIYFEKSNILLNSISKIIRKENILETLQ